MIYFTGSMMRHLLGYLFLIIFLSGCAQGEQHLYNVGINIIPKPKNINLSPGEFCLDNGVKVFCSHESLREYADSLVNKIFFSSGIKMGISISKPENKYINLELKEGFDIEEYALEVKENGISVYASDTGGLYYGLQTLFQLFPAEIERKGDSRKSEYRIPCLKINDYPSMAYRGVLIDVCRHFFTVGEIKKQIDILGSLKINKLHLHLTDNQGWRIEIKKYPELVECSSVAETYNGEKYGPFYYTQDDIREIVAYAGLHNVEVIPEIEFPGHSLSALVPFPELSCSGGPFRSEQVFGYEENVFCAGNENVYKFMQDVLTEVAALFPSEYIHIGGDECAKTRWRVCPKCQAKARELGLKDEQGKTVEEQLQSYAIHRVEHFISNDLKKKMIGWHEVLEGGINKDVTIMSWRDPQIGYRAAVEGHDVIMAPMPEGFYLCDYQGAVEVEPAASGEFSSLKQLYCYNAVSDTSSLKLKQHIIGLEACAWTEWCKDINTLEYFMYPRVVALAENAWTDTAQKDWADFQKRLDNMYVRLKYKEVKFHIPMPEGVLTQNAVLTKDTLNLCFRNSRALPMVYTDDGTMPTVDSKLLPERLVVDESCTLKISTLVAGCLLSPVREFVVEKQVEPKKALDKVSDKIRVQIADGLYPSEIDLDRLHFIKDTLIAAMEDFNKDKFDFRKPSVAVYTGYFEIPETGVYIFMSNDDELWIDNEKVIENPSSSRFYACKKEVFLEQGKHEFRLVFVNRLKDGFAACWYNIGFVYKKSA